VTEAAGSTIGAGDVRSDMFDLIVAYRKSQIVRTAAMMSLAEHCASGPVTAESIAAAESADPGTTARFMRACAAIGLLTCRDEKYFSGTELLDVLRKDAEGSQWGFAVSLPAPGTWLPWSQLPEAVRTGRSQARNVIGGHIFEYYEHHQEERDAFTAGVSGFTAVAGAQAAKVLDTSNVRLAVDVGGATGTLLHDLMTVNSTMRGIVLDRPAAVPLAEEAARTLGLQDRITARGGDFTKSVPAGGDLYLLRYVLHDWEDETCIQILRRCREAMAPGARVVVIEMVLGSIGREPEVVPSQDLNMLAVLEGRERTVAEFDELIAAAGLRRRAVHVTDSPTSIIEAVAD
jgi:precorrin-6B methylase 2